MSLISIGEIIDRSWQHYTKNFVELVSVSAWILIVAVLNILSLWLYPQFTTAAPHTLSVMEIIGVIVYLVTFLIVAPILSLWISNTLIKTIDREYNDKPAVLKLTAKEGWRAFFPRVLVGLQVLVVLIASLLFSVPGVLVSAIAGGMHVPVLILFGSLLLLVGTILTSIFGLKWIIELSFAPYALLIDDQHGRDALRRSRSLVAGRWWATLWRVTIPQVVFFFGMLTLEVILVLILNVIVANIAGFNSSLATRLFTMGQNSVFVILMSLATPLLLTANYLVYQSLKERR